MNIKVIKCILFITLALFSSTIMADNWPKEIKTAKGGKITVYQPQPENLSGNKLDGRAAFSAMEMAGNDLTFGVFWFTAMLATDRDSRTATLESITINNIKLPGIDDSTKINKLKQLLTMEIPKWQLEMSLEEITTTIEREGQQDRPALKNDAPTVRYTTQPTLLVAMDGEPKLQDDKQLNMKRVLNTAFLLVQNPDDNKYYLYGGQVWYASSSLKDGYKPVGSLPQKIAAIDQQVKKDESTTPAKKTTTPPTPLITTTPTELIQSDGQADFANIAGTNLLYMSNSDDDVFKNIGDQLYYVLLSGRWYSAQKLEGPWKYIASDQLPPDFAKIPEGSAKDNVLSSVAGTQASKDAIMDAQVPQTAKVDRKTATCTVTYDGDPKFEPIEGTSMELAMNTSSTVMKANGKYYCVETGVWFVANSPTGPWAVSDERPKEVDKIPPSSPAYNTQYVYIYDSTPSVVYVGYTPGYMGCYVYGPTVVYGSGYYYNPWYGPYYYPRPVTYGFSMHYNPWTGWSMGFHFSTGCFSFSAYGHPGYWGPPMYRPPYHPPYHGGMYGRGPTYVHHTTNININNSNNIYNRRNDVTTVDRGNVNRGQGNNGGNRPTTKDQQPSRGGNPGVNNNLPANSKAKNNVYSGKDGSVYQRNDNGNWDQRNGNQWENKGKSQTMDKDFQQRQRSTQQNSNFNSMNHGGNMGGGMRGGGGGGGGRRGR